MTTAPAFLYILHISPFPRKDFMVNEAGSAQGILKKKLHCLRTHSVLHDLLVRSNKKSLLLLVFTAEAIAH